MSELNRSVVSKLVVVPVALVGLGIIGLVLARTVVRPYDVPEFQEIDTSDSAFLIPLEGDTNKQQIFPSEEYLNKQKIAAKRVQIPHQWQQTGFFPGNGKYVPTLRMVKVDRKPVTREWTRAKSNGTSAKDEAVSAESKDSINFTVGIACTANIPEDLAATFLYTYPSSSLADVMDGEIRARIQQVFAEEAARHPFSEMLGQKTEMMDAVRTDVIPFFEKRGIKISTVGMLGGLQFENVEIQKAIDDAVKSQQQKIVAEAKRAAQEIENVRIKMEAQAFADAEILKSETQAKLQRLAALAEVEAQASRAKAEAEAKKLVAQLEAEAESIKAESQAKAKLKVAEAEADAMKKQAEVRLFEAEQAMQTGTEEILMRFRQIELESARWKQWNGTIPSIPQWHAMTSAVSPFAAILFPQSGPDSVSKK
jgi:SPFH domain / Band 7 family